MHGPLANVRETLLMGPGPSCISPEVYQALALPAIGHLDPVFLGIMDAVKESVLRSAPDWGRWPAKCGVSESWGIPPDLRTSRYSWIG